MGFKKWEFFSRDLGELILSSFFFFFDFASKWCSVHIRNDFVMLSFYPEDFRFNIYVL